MPASLLILPLGCASVLLLIAAYQDLTSYRIPNWISVALVLLFVPYGYLQNLSFESLALRAGIGGAVLVLGMWLHARGFVGGGDVKLLSALSLWLAPVSWPMFMLLMMVFGGGLALVVLVLRKLKDWIPENVRVGRKVRILFSEEQGIPYGLAISLSGLIALGESFEQLKHGL